MLHATQRWLLACVAMLAFASGPVFAQGVTTAGLLGTVIDESGEPIPGANVIAVHTPSGTRYGAATNLDGFYRIPNMRVGGPYRVETSFVGLQTDVVEGLQLTLGEFAELNVTLREDAQVLDGVTVTAGGVFDPSRSGVDTNLSEEQIEALPTVGRDLADFVRFTPQAYVDNDDDDGPAISIAGQNNRYNSIYIDGAVSNDVFGLSAQGTNGGQTGSTPISLDAIEQFQIALSPFDVSQSGFTGGAINAVTRSGTNTFEGSVYGLFRNEGLAGTTPGALLDDGEEATRLADFSNNRYGFRLGGPIIQDKLFFFANGEILRAETPLPSQLGDYRGDSGGRLDEIRQALINEFGYDAGAFGDKASTLDDNKALLKLDWNASQSTRVSARYSYSGSDNIDQFQSTEGTVNYANNAEFFPNRTHSFTGEVNSTLGNNASNKLILGYTRVRDDRDNSGDPFPFVQIDDGAGRIQLGSEQFSTANRLDQDVYTLTNNFSYFLGDHTISAGVNVEYFEIGNLFIPRNFGFYQYDSVDDFLQSVRAVNDPNVDFVAPTQFRRGYSLVDGVAGDESAAIGAFNAVQVGVYAQDEFRVTPQLRVTAGIRADIPKVTSTPRVADDADQTLATIEAAGYDLNGAQAGETPAARIYLSPRFGFNYDLSEMAGRQVQLRGGTGIFTGRVPFVWPGGMFLNNGTNTGEIRVRSGDGVFLPNGDPVPFEPDVQQALDGSNFGRPASDLIPSGRLEVFEEGFRYPSVWRTSLGIDAELPGGFVGTIEGQYTNTIANVLVRNVNLDPTGLTTTTGPGARTIYTGGEIDDRYTNINVVGTTGEGYAYDVTARVQRNFADVVGESDLSVFAAYTFGDSYVVNDGTSSQLNTLWESMEIGANGPNDLQVTRSDFSLGNRVIAGATFSTEFLNNLGTQISLFYTGETGRPFSYVIDNFGDLVGTSSRDIGMVYVPASGEQLSFDSPADQAAFDAFVNSSDYLSGQRGDFAERNGLRAPFEHIFDLKIEQELFGNIGGARRTLSATLDIFNVANLINRDWGVRYDGVGAINLLEFEGFEPGTRTPTYSYDLGNIASEEELFDTLVKNDASLYNSRWFAQLGLRLTF